jgi:peroxiredoxin
VVVPGKAACSEKPAGTEEGDLVEDFALTDQSGATVHISDYCGQVIYIPMGAMWCPACKADAEEIPGLVAQYGSEGLVVLNVMAETARGDAPGTADLQTWADTYGIVTPVLSDPGWGVWKRYWPEGETPHELLIDRDGRIVNNSYVWSDQIGDMFP